MDAAPATSRRWRKCLVVQYRGILSADWEVGGVVVMSLMAMRRSVKSGPPPTSEMPKFIRLREMKGNQLWMVLK